ncbi:MAG: ribosomal L7Ae/L30e/S12e/Gadd45 family protein [Clostridia bacterium]
MQTDDHLLSADKVVGINQSIKLIRRNKAKKVYLANDVDELFKKKVMCEIANVYSIEIDTTYSASELAEREGIAVPCSIVTIALK